MEKKLNLANRYDVLKKIGEGGMAKVYLGYDQKTEMQVAIKVLRKENVIDKKVKNFKREAQVLGLMDDDNIVKIHDVGEQGTIHYIITEYVEGMTMKDYLTTCSPIPIEEVVDMTLQVLGGINHAHEKGVIHKDIKSQNILLNEDKNVKITDFGIASIVDTEHTRTQSLMGTPQYVAPEILNRDELTIQSDIYSVGILMFELLTGKAPFTGEKPGIIMMKQMNQPIPSVINERVDVPQSLENVIIKATAKKLNNRYKNAQEMIEDLETVLKPERKFEEKHFLINDIVSNEKVDKTVSLNPDFDINSLVKEGEFQKKSDNRKKIFVALTLIAVVIMITLIMVFSKPPIEMPDVVGKSEEDAISEIEITGFTADNIEIVKEPSEDIDAGYVISSTPEAGEVVTEDETAIIKVSTGLEKNVIENYETKLISNVEGQLTKKGYTVEIEYEDSSLPRGTIISQSPEAGSSITVEDTIVFQVSTGNFTVQVPNFNGLELDAAETWAADYSIKVNTTYACNDQFNENEIYDQTPEIGSEVANGGSITVYVSDGTCSVSETTNEDDTSNNESTNETIES